MKLDTLNLEEEKLIKTNERARYIARYQRVPESPSFGWEAPLDYPLDYGFTYIREPQHPNDILKLQMERSALEKWQNFARENRMAPKEIIVIAYDMTDIRPTAVYWCG